MPKFIAKGVVEEREERVWEGLYQNDYFSDCTLNIGNG